MATRRQFTANSTADVIIKDDSNVPWTAGETKTVETIQMDPVIALPETPALPTPGELALKEIPFIMIADVDQNMMELGCRKLLSFCPDETRELVLEFQASQGGDVPLWQIIGGYILRCRELGEIMTPFILPDWAELRQPGTVRACGTCGLGLKTRTWSQKYCCNTCFFGKLNSMGHTDDCSLVKD